jgi:hypothetical protein
VACRLKGKKRSLVANQAVLPSGVKVMRHCSRASEMTSGAKRSATAGAACRATTMPAGPAGSSGRLQPPSVSSVAPSAMTCRR